MRVAHLNLTGRRVDDGDEVFSAEIPPDSSLILPTGLALLPDRNKESGQSYHSTGRVLGISASPSPPGKAELSLPAWAHGRKPGSPRSRRWSVGPLWGTGVD